MRARPISLIVFGILNIGYGAFNVLSLLLSQIVLSAAKTGSAAKSLSSDPGQTHLMFITGGIDAAAGVFLAVAGVGLLLCKNWGRMGSLGWAIFDILFVLLTIPQGWHAAQAFAPQFGSAFAMVVTILGLLVSLAYPLVLVVFMRRPKLVEACRNPA